MKVTTRRYALLLWLAAAIAFVSPTWAQEEKAFAEHKIVLQLSDGSLEKQQLVLSVASNVMKYYGPDLVEIEIVAFGPGLQLLYKDNINKDRINGLVVSGGVRFSACENTLITLHRKLGHEVELNENAKIVQAGVVRLKELVDQGYLLVRP